MSKWWSYALSVLMGVLGAGGTIALVYSFEAADAASRPRTKIVREEVRIEEVENSATARKLRASQRALERRLAQLEEWSNAEADDEKVRDQSNPVEHDPEEAYQQGLQVVSALDERHAQDPVDPTWAPTADKELRSGLSEAAEDVGFVVSSVSCKTDICVAELEWEDQKIARERGASLASLDFPNLNCMQSIWLDRTDQPDQPYSGKLYLDCTELRAGLAD